MLSPSVSWLTLLLPLCTGWNTAETHGGCPLLCCEMGACPGVEGSLWRKTLQEQRGSENGGLFQSLTLFGCAFLFFGGVHSMYMCVIHTHCWKQGKQCSAPLLVAIYTLLMNVTLRLVTAKRSQHLPLSPDTKSHVLCQLHPLYGHPGHLGTCLHNAACHWARFFVPASR